MENRACYFTAIWCDAFPCQKKKHELFSMWKIIFQGKGRNWINENYEISILCKNDLFSFSVSSSSSCYVGLLVRCDNFNWAPMDWGLVS